MTRNYDVVIVGAGVVGTAIAYFLSLDGISAAVVDKRGIGAGSSDHGPGFFNTFGGDFQPGSHLGLAVESVRLIREHRAELGKFSDDAAWFNDKPDLAVAFDEAGEQRIHEMYAGAQRQLDASGEPGEWLDADTVRRLEPLIADNVRSAIRFPSVIQIDGWRLARLYTGAAAVRGVDTITDEVTGITYAGSRVTAVTTRGSGDISAGSFVFAMGNWSPIASVWLGYPIPICSLKGQLEVLQAPKEYSLGFHVMESIVLMQYPDGRFLLGATPDAAPGGGLAEPESYIRPLSDTDPSSGDESLLLSRGRKRFPFLKTAKVIGHKSGVRPMSPDLLPIVGRVPTWDNAFLATGHGRKGIHLSPGTGALMHDLIVGSETSAMFEAADFSPSRFMPAKL